MKHSLQLFLFMALPFLTSCGSNDEQEHFGPQPGGGAMECEGGCQYSADKSDDESGNN